MKIKILIVTCLTCNLFFSSCVTLLGKKQTIYVDSYPQGATVYAGDKYIGTTPCAYKSKKAASTLTFEKNGYQSRTIETSLKMRGAIWWNIPFTFLAGVLVDAPYWFNYADIRYNTKLAAIPQPKTYTPKPSVISPTAPSEMRATHSTLSRIAISNSNTEMKAKAIYKKYKSAVFMIYTSDNVSVSQGSGFFVSSDGIGISNYHVFKGTFKGKEVVKLSNGTTYRIKEVLAYSEKYDYILFKIDGSGFNYIPVTQRGYEIGDEVYAIGSPRGMENTLSNGLISQSHGEHYIQISVPIDHGSSGGALINCYGEVIGITSGGRDDSGANLNFARDIRAIFEQK